MRTSVHVLVVASLCLVSAGVAVVRHGTSDRHGYLTISVEPTAPHKVVNIGMRTAKPEEIKGGAGASANFNGTWDGYSRFQRAGRPGRS